MNILSYQKKKKKHSQIQEVFQFPSTSYEFLYFKIVTWEFIISYHYLLLMWIGVTILFCKVYIKFLFIYFFQVIWSHSIWSSSSTTRSWGTSNLCDTQCSISHSLVVIQTRIVIPNSLVNLGQGIFPKEINLAYVE